MKCDRKGEIMEQHISLEQLKEIDSSLIASKLIKTGLIKHNNSELIRTKKFAKKFTVGKMIEILKSKLGYENDVRIVFDSEVDRWEVSYNLMHIEEPYKVSVNRELCDALWDMIKSGIR